MGYTWENDCVGCERCRGCGRKYDYKRYFCDSCDDTADEDNPLYDYEGEELCKNCLLERLTSKICDDMDDTRCSDCGSEDENMYFFEGKWYCEDCVLKQFEKVCLDDQEGTANEYR